MIPKQTIEEIMQAARIEEVVGDFVALKKRGVNMLGNCPFHNEKTPSFTVSPNKGIYKCFGCGKAGNSVGFIMEHEKLNFSDALKYLAKKYNIEIKEDFQQSDEEKQAYNERESLFIALQYAQEFFAQNLLEHEEGKTIGLSYFNERGFRSETIKKFGLGYALNSFSALLEKAEKAGYKKEYLEKAGLVKTTEAGRSFDMFRERVIFPIHNLSGRVIAFGARQLKKDDKGPKYLNSPESEVYKKSDGLYGIFFAKNAIRNFDKCYLVEGYTDVITLNQSGIENVVASSGTSLTPGQIKQISRFTHNVTVLYDGDQAGIKASLRGVDLILEAGLQVRIVIFPDGEDPDSYCRKAGGEEFKNYIQANEQDFVLFKARLLSGETKNDPIRKTEAIRSILESIAKIPDPLYRSTFIQECAKIMESDQDLLAREVSKLRLKEKTGLKTEEEINPLLEDFYAPDQNTETIKEVFDTLNQERDLLEKLMRFAQLEYVEGQSVAQFLLESLRADEISFQNEIYEKCFRIILEAYDNQLPLDQAFFLFHEDQDMCRLAADFFSDKAEVSKHWERYDIIIPSVEKTYKRDVREVLLYLKLKRIELVIRQNTENLKNAQNDEELMSYLGVEKALKEARNHIAKELGTVVVR